MSQNYETKIFTKYIFLEFNINQIVILSKNEKKNNCLYLNTLDFLKGSICIYNLPSAKYFFFKHKLFDVQR